MSETFVEYGSYVKQTRLKLEYSYTQNISENTTTFSLKLYAEKPSNTGSHYYNYNNSVYTISGKSGNQLINGTGNWSWGSTSLYKVGESTYTYSHNADGTGSCTLSASWTTGLTSSSVVGNNMTISVPVTLPTIPRASSISATDANIGSSSAIIINYASESFTHTVTYSFKNLSGTIVTKTSQKNFAWTVPTSFFQQIPNNDNGTVTLTCTTYSGNTQIGSPTTTTMTATVPYSGTYNSTPVITSATARDTNSTTLALTGNDPTRLVLYKSTVQLSATGQCKNYAGLKGFKENNIYSLTTSTSVSGGTTTVTGTKTYSSSSTPVFNQTQFKLCLIDTRNVPSATKILNQASGDFTIVPYVPLTMNATVERTSATSSSIYLSFSGNVYNGYFDANNSNFNELTLKWRYKETGGSWITTGASDTTNGWRNLTKNTHYRYESGNKYHSGSGSSQSAITISNLFDYQKSYVIEIYYKDSLSTYTVQKTLSTGTPVHDEGIDSNGNNYFNVNGDIYRNNINITGKVLYEDSSGTSGTVTLNETAANFDYLDIFLNRSDWKYQIRVHSPNGKKVIATTSQYYSNADTIYIYTKKMVISGTSITVDYARGQSIGGTAFVDSNQKIEKVVGYK